MLPPAQGLLRPSLTPLSLFAPSTHRDGPFPVPPCSFPLTPLSTSLSPFHVRSHSPLLSPSHSLSPQPTPLALDLCYAALTSVTACPHYTRRHQGLFISSPTTYHTAESCLVVSLPIFLNMYLCSISFYITLRRP